MPVSLAHRRRTLPAVAVAVSILLLAGSAAVVAATRSVAIADFAFSPKSITINVGDRVTWTNSDAVSHTATASNGSFDTGSIDEGESASVRFTQAGTYRYVCTPHPTMTGTIRVRAASGGGATAPPSDTVVPDAPSGTPSIGAAAIASAVLAVLILAFLVPRRRRSD